MNRNVSKNEYPRHIARRAVLQAIYGHVLNGEENREKLLGDVTSLGNSLPKPVEEFSEKLLEAAIERIKLANSVIMKVIENWELDRINILDRCILYIGIAEFVDFPDIAPNVSIDEAVELAKEFGSIDSPKFVNGILDAVLRLLIEMKMVENLELRVQS